jgi:[acyl-carrier-protein] S-malonyltransferase
MGVAFVFPGQGAQTVGMGRALAESYPEAREAFAEADAALGEPLSKLCFEGPQEELTRTANTQPAVLTTDVAAYRAVQSAARLSPTLVAGHSLGEYAALVAAGSLGLGEAVRLTRVRGRAMQDAVPEGEGAMAAVLLLDRAVVASICEEAAQGRVCAPANFNAPGQIVIAGHSDAVARAVEIVKARKGKAVPLKVSAPFHCELMRPAAQVLEAALRDVEVRAPAVPVVANVDASPNTDAGRIKDLLIRQVASPVRWEESVRRMIEAGVRKFVEVGPGSVLAGLIKRIDRSVEVVSVSDPDAVRALASEAA